MSVDPPHVTIGLPVYNGERLVGRAVRSLLDQTFTDFELIISDNASTDRTVEVIRSAAAGDPRVVLLRNDVNRGAAWNYNRVVEAARGELFRWHAHDDWCEPRHLATLVDVLDQQPEVIMAHPWTRFIDDAGDTVGSFDDDVNATSPDPACRIGEIVRRLTYCNMIYGLVRRDTLAETALIAPFPRSDVPLLYELAAAGPIVSVPDRSFVGIPASSLRANRGNRKLASWFSPSGRGRWFPAAWMWWGSVRGIARWTSGVDRLRTLWAFHRAWPIEYARQARRRRRRARQGIHT